MNSDQEMKEFLEPTKYCDFNHTDIITKAKELTEKNKTPKEKALSIFHFVRDKIDFLMEYEGEKASKILERKYGACGTKSVLQVSLLRSVNIPARFRIVSLQKECLKGIVSEFYYNKIPEIIQHSWCECYLSGKWIICDATMDKKITDIAYQKGIFTREDIPTIDWDGEQDANIYAKWFTKDEGAIAGLEKIYDVKVSIFYKALLKMVTKRSNAYTKKLRNSQP
ncbi:MAG: transglutaminase-like domain-containing protein [Candidatus Heimdallarchaeota archaeon]